MARQFEKSYRISENDDVLDKENKVHQDLDMRMDAIETIAEEFRTGNRADVDALIQAIEREISEKSALIQSLLDEADAGFTPDRIAETVSKRFTSDAEQQAHIDALAAEKVRIDARATSAALGAHTSATNNPHGVTAAQVGTLTTAQIDEDLEILEAALKGGVDPSLDTFAKIAAALAKRLRVDAAQTFSAAEMGRARANVDASILGGFRNKFINGDFQIAQRGSSFTVPANTGAYVADRWIIQNATNQPCTIFLTPHSYDVGSPVLSPGHPIFYATARFATAPTSGLLYIVQHIENVRTLVGKLCTLRGFLKAPAAAAADVVAPYARQFFGSGASAEVTTAGFSVGPMNIATAYHATDNKREALITPPSLVGKAVAAGSFLEMGFTIAARAAGDYQWGHMSLVEGDATAEEDCFALRHIATEQMLCERYYEIGGVLMSAYSSAGQPIAYTRSFNTPKRTAPAVSFPTMAYANASGASAVGLSASGFVVSALVTALGAATINGSFIADAEI